MSVPADILEKIIGEKWGATEIALELAARRKISGYKPFSMTTAQLRTRLEEKLVATPLFDKQERISELSAHALTCRVNKGKCLECSELYDLAGHDAYMDAKWRRDEQKRVADIDRSINELGAPFVPSSIIEAVHDVGAGLTQYIILFRDGKGYVTLDARACVHSQDLRGIALLELPALFCQVLDHHNRHVIKK